MKRLIISLNLLSIILALTGLTLIAIIHADNADFNLSKLSDSALKPPTVVVTEEKELVLFNNISPAHERQLRVVTHEPNTIPRVIPTIKSWPHLERVAYKSPKSRAKQFRVRPHSQSVQEYTVAKNDTVASIAQQFNVTPQSIIQLNRLGNPRVIHRGLVLQIPASEGVTAVAESLPQVEPILTQETEVETAVETAVTEPIVETVITEEIVETAVETAIEPILEPTSVPNDGEQVYTVRSGDTLQIIANQYGVTIEALAHYNDLNNWSVIYPDQLLQIPPANYAAPAPTELPPSASGYIWPINSRSIAQWFHSGHGAIDILIASGSNVLAIAGGTVEYAGWHDYGYGYMVLLAHDDGSRSLYAHNSDLLVAHGQYVSQGDVIALSGNTGRSTHPHLHLEIMVGAGQYVNPCDYLPGGC